MTEDADWRSLSKDVHVAEGLIRNAYAKTESPTLKPLVEAFDEEWPAFHLAKKALKEHPGVYLKSTYFEGHIWLDEAQDQKFVMEVDDRRVDGMITYILDFRVDDGKFKVYDSRVNSKKDEVDDDMAAEVGLDALHTAMSFVSAIEADYDRVINEIFQ